MFNLQATNQSEIKMTSQDIASLLEARHDSVKRTIERLVEKEIIQLPPMVIAEKINGLGLNQSTKVYNFVGEKGKRDSIIVVAQLSPEFTAKLVDRWQELEQQNSVSALPNFNNPVEAARAWADQVEERQKLEQTLSIAAPKAEFVDSYVESEGSFGFREVAKILGIKENILRSYLLENDIMYYLKDKLTGRAYHITQGRFVTKTGTSSSGNAFSQTKFTPKGVYWLAKKLDIEVDSLPDVK